MTEQPEKLRITVSPPMLDGAAPAPPRQPQAFDLLLKIESEARKAATVGELTFLIANETPKIVRARQVFVLVKKGAKARVETVSSVAGIERNAPRIRWIEALVAGLSADVGLASTREFVLPAYCPAGDAEHENFPFPYLAWVPLKLRDGHVFAGMLLARDTPWNEPTLLLAERLAETFAHAWAALSSPKRLKRNIRFRPVILAALAVAGAAGFIPVPLTVLAPSVIVAVEPRIVAAPIDGVVQSIGVDPDQVVRAGEPLARMSDTMLRNEADVAEQEVNVALAKLKRTTQAAVADPKMRAELAIARTELSLATAKRDYAREMLGRVEITAPVDGVAIFADKQRWIGHPVSTGERLMEIADPERLQLRIDVPVADAIAISNGASARAFLDSDPLRPLGATVHSVSYEAQMIEGNMLVYRIYATIAEKRPDLRLGIRGTAQISGAKVPLAYYVFRRPVAAIRQRLGL